MLFKAYSLANPESNPSFMASQKTLANLLPTELWALEKSILVVSAWTFVGAIKRNIERSIDIKMKIMN